MSVRPRNSPNLQACEVGDSNKNASEETENGNQSEEQKEEENLNNQSKLKLYGAYAIITFVAIGLLGLAYYFGTLSRSSSIKPSSPADRKMKLKMHWEGDKDVLNKYGDKDGDACVILGDCFKSWAPDYISSPLNPYKNCHDDLKTNLLNSFDNGFYYEGSRLIGFISASTKIENAGYGKILIYNVCIRKEDRGKRVGKYMVPEFIKIVSTKRIPKTTPKVYIGLDVNLESETFDSAFGLYAKLGFIRWWQLGRVSTLDFKILEDQESKAKDSSNPVYELPLAKFILGGKEFIKTQVKDEKGNKIKHLAMIMMKDKDDFGDIGKMIKEARKEA
jgi:ribosomal protein S18 acetylase RimI-like enzyme